MASAIVMPKAGNSVEECLLSKWRIKVGDVIKEKDIICDVETDKSAIEVEATAGGTVLALFGNEQDLIPVLQTICVVYFHAINVEDVVALHGCDDVNACQHC